MASEGTEFDMQEDLAGKLSNSEKSLIRLYF